MTSKEKRAREIRRSIGEVLLRNWDPVSVRGEPQARDEYDAYVGGVCKLISSGSHCPRARHAKKLLKLNVRLESDGRG